MTHHPSALDDLLRADHNDPGCNAGATVLDAFVDLEVSGEDAAATYPDWEVHLHACPACRQDYEGLLEAARLFGD